MTCKPVLVLNAGSSSIKVAVFGAGPTPLLAGAASDIGADATLRMGDTRRTLPLPDHRAALHAILEALAARGFEAGALAAAGHRVVHGGAALTRPARLTREVRAEIAACAALAPLHNPHSLAAMEALDALAPDLVQCASFDTAFHATNPEVATRYALPDTRETAGLRRYGFHGLSYGSLVDRLPEISGAPLPRRLLAFHLGNGASLCAIEDGRSVATTMGHSPLDGLTMGTRCGTMDAGAVLDLVAAQGVARTRALLNGESGLLGLSGESADMRALLASDAPASAFAVDHFCYWALRHAGAMIAAMGGCDALAFTGGIGENAAGIRARLMAELGWIGLRPDPARNRAHGPRLHADDSPVAAWVVPAEEERVIARDARMLLEGAA
jgi:acetate kinase